jgi:hypothetical protein
MQKKSQNQLLDFFKKNSFIYFCIEMSTSRGITVRDVAPQQFIESYAKFLKRSGRIDVPKWADIVKTGTHKQLAPLDPDWFFVRCGKY